MSITIGGKDLKNTIIDCQDTDIKSTTTKIKDKDVLLATLLIKTISNGSGCWLINDPGHIQTRNNASILGCLSLSIIKVC